MAIINLGIASSPVITSSRVTISIMRGRTNRLRFPVMQSRSTANMMQADRKKARGLALLP